MHSRASSHSTSPALRPHLGMRFGIRTALVLITTSGLFLAGCNAQHQPIQATTAPQAIAPEHTARPAPITVVDNVRESVPTDFMRISFMNPLPPSITQMYRSNALRAFTTATVLYNPPLPLSTYPYYSGLENFDSSTLVAMRCQPTPSQNVDAFLATWINVFAAIQRDVPVTDSLCNSNPTDPGQQVSCYVRTFVDTPQNNTPTALASIFAFAARMYTPQNQAMASWLSTTYGISTAFAGSGYSIKDSYNISGGQPMSSQQVLVKSISSEYLLKNVRLTDANCRCITVAPYAGRSSDPLDPNFVWGAGGSASCQAVPKLQPAPKKP